jgi:hypothetical protein
VSRHTLRCDGVNVPEYRSGSGALRYLSARNPPHYALAAQNPKWIDKKGERYQRAVCQ